MDGDFKPRKYFIPHNFIDQGRVVKGMFQLRNFAEGFGMAIIAAAFIILLFPSYDIMRRITLLTAVCVPLMAIGINGFNGDAWSTTVKNAYRWKKERDVMLYDENVKPVIKTPLDVMMEKEIPKDKIIDFVENIKKKSQNKNNASYIEGINFEFAVDKDIADLYAETVIKSNNDDIEEIIEERAIKKESFYLDINIETDRVDEEIEALDIDISMNM